MTQRKGIARVSALLPGVLLFAACQSPAEKVASEKQEAAKEIHDAEVKEQKTEQRAAQRVADAQTSEAREDAKVKGTKEVAQAKEKVGDEKVEATKEVTKAEVANGQGGTYEKR